MKPFIEKLTEEEKIEEIEFFNEIDGTTVINNDPFTDDAGLLYDNIEAIKENEDIFIN